MLALRLGLALVVHGLGTLRGGERGLERRGLEMRDGDAEATELVRALVETVVLPADERGVQLETA